MLDSQSVTTGLEEFLESLPSDVVAVYLFGSVARDEATSTSDVDLAFLYARTPPRTLLDRPYALAAEASARVGRDVDIVVLNDASPELCHQVFKDGVLLLERDRAARVRFEVYARNQYFDVLPILKRYRNASVSKSKP